MGVRKLVDFTAVSNPMLRFLLEDGNELRIQMALMKVYDTGERNADGAPVYQLGFQQMVEIVPPDDRIDASKLIKGA